MHTAWDFLLGAKPPPGDMMPIAPPPLVVTPRGGHGIPRGKALMPCPPPHIRAVQTLMVERGAFRNDRIYANVEGDLC